MRPRIGETHVYPSRFSPHSKWETHSHGEEVANISEGLKIVIWDKTESKTIVLKSGDAAILPHNTWIHGILRYRTMRSPYETWRTMLEPWFLIKMVHGSEGARSL